MYYPQTIDEIEQGNPEVLPEYSYKFEFGLNHYLGNFNIIPETFLSIVRNVFDIEEGVLTYTVSLKRYINAGDGRHAGLSLYISYSPGNLMSLSLNPSYGWYSYRDVSTYYYRINANLSFLLSVAMFQLAVNYEGLYVMVWGKSEPTLLFQLAFSTRIRDFDITLSAMDPFKTYKYAINVNADDYSAYKYNAIKWMYINLNVRYNIQRKFNPPKPMQKTIRNTEERMLRR